MPYHSAAITQYDPYIDMTRINLSYISSFSPNILHPTHPIIPLPKAKDAIPSSTTRRFLIPVVLIFLIPLWGLFFLLASFYQSFFSSIRIRQHLQLQDRDTAEDTKLNEAVQKVFEDVVDNTSLFSRTEDNIDEYFDDQHVSEETNPLLEGVASEKPVSFKREEYRLPLTEDQLNMMSGLRTSSWDTFGVHIQKTMHSHAAIIQRSKGRKELSEGEMVIQHWLQGQFEV